MAAKSKVRQKLVERYKEKGQGNSNENGCKNISQVNTDSDGSDLQPMFWCIDGRLNLVRTSLPLSVSTWLRLWLDG